MTPSYQYNVGEIIETHDDKFGIITDRTNAHDYMSFQKDMSDSVIHSYMHIAIYKVLIDGRISYVNESNIRGIIECQKELQRKQS